ncbi:MAG: hypothetical protein QME47_07745, partial [Candidatus Thermoplasmatota archaeon]|nr:hypothetical protein [Candidatus Thermoplasmatota archaeon]
SYLKITRSYSLYTIKKILMSLYLSKDCGRCIKGKSTSKIAPLCTSLQMPISFGWAFAEEWEKARH